MSTTTSEEMAALAEGRKQCLLGFHAWVPWLAVHYPNHPRDGAVSFYTTWCARDGCDHTEQWDCA